MNLEQRGDKSRCKCGCWSNFCCTNDIIDHIVVNPYPKDDRCGCPVCPTCRYLKPCELCNGNCPVCIGLINPGPLDLNSTYVIKATINNDAFQITENVKLMYSEDPVLQLKAIQHFRRLSSIEKTPPIKAIIDSGIVPKLVDFLQRHENPDLQFQVAWTLTNIASGTSEQTRVVIESGAVPIFVQLLQSSPSDDVREQVAWALGNIAGDSVECRDHILSLGAMPVFISAGNAFTEQSRLSIIRNTTWSLSNLCRGKPAPDLQIVRQALPLLARLLNSQDPDTVTDACWALSYISDGSNDRIAAVLEAGVAPRLIELLGSRHQSVLLPAIRTTGNIVTGDDTQTQTMINLNVLPALLPMLVKEKKRLTKETCWAISNIAAGTDLQSQAVIDCGVFKKLIKLIKRTDDFDIQKEVTWAIVNAILGGTPQQKLHIAQQITISLFNMILNMLRVEDAKLITVVLEAIENVLKVANDNCKVTLTSIKDGIINSNGLQTIKTLQTHKREAIVKRSGRILTYFQEESETLKKDEVVESLTLFRSTLSN